MNVTLLGFLLGSMLTAATPLQVAGVVRIGMPPYEDSGRLYRLEGDGCQILGVSEFLTLRRSGERRNIGRLQVTAIKEGYALARLADSGETYPLKGDLAVRPESARALPALPQPEPELTVAIEALAPVTPKLAIPASLSKVGIHSEPIYFIKGSADLSKAAVVKLNAWVSAWSLDGRWVLLVPATPEPAISQARVEVLKAALKELGVVALEMRSLPSGPPTRYDAITVSKEPW